LKYSINPLNIGHDAIPLYKINNCKTDILILNQIH
jgi:hypothetical protein